jgi:hypothetical protein
MRFSFQNERTSCSRGTKLRSVETFLYIPLSSNKKAFHPQSGRKAIAFRGTTRLADKNTGRLKPLNAGNGACLRAASAFLMRARG